MKKEQPINENQSEEPLEEGFNDSTGKRENITRHLPFVLFLSVLLLTYIYFTHHTERKIRKISNLQKEVKELYSEYITLQTEILNGSRSSNLEQKMLKQEIKPAVEPPIIIK